MRSSSIFPGQWDATAIIVVLCSSLAAYNAIELVLLIFTTFNAYKGLYFWSLAVATIGIVPYVVGLAIFYFNFAIKLPGLIINNIGWIATVVGQSVVLYSRLGVVVGETGTTLLRLVKWMIIIDAVVFYILTTTIVFGTHYSSDGIYDSIYVYVEKIQMTGFCIQEFIISGIYIWKTIGILNEGQKKHAHRTLWQLLAINLVIVGFDIALLVIEYLNLMIPEIAFKALAYSVKLKLEFAILSKLVEISNLNQRDMSIAWRDPSIIENLDSSGTTGEKAVSPMAGQSTWPELEKVNTNQEQNSRSDDSFRTTSHQTDGSEQPLFRPGLTPIRSQSMAQETDDYHDMIKVISTA